ncbi:hypothetical protein ACFL4T_14425 [candidate division KSB1 bacterium]
MQQINRGSQTAKLKLGIYHFLIRVVIPSRYTGIGIYYHNDKISA